MDDPTLAERLRRIPTTTASDLLRDRGIARVSMLGISQVAGPPRQISNEIADSYGEILTFGVKDSDWNDYVIIAKGNHVQHFINGKQTVDVTDNDAKNAPKEGILALQIHAGPAMVVQFKELVLKTEKEK